MQNIFLACDLRNYERVKTEKELLVKLQEGESAVRDGDEWMTLEKLKASVEVVIGDRFDNIE